MAYERVASPLSGGSYLRFRLEDLFDEASRQRDYYSLFYFLLSKGTLAPASDIMPISANSLPSRLAVIAPMQ